MLHKTVATEATVTDLGEFSAIAAAWTVDRQKDQIARGAFAWTIIDWQASDKRLPLHWNHRGEAENVIGSVDPHSMREIDEGLYVEGKLDLHDSTTAREAWRSMKANRVGLSFGYLANRSHKRTDGIKQLDEIDLFEISIVPVPANPNTRILRTKSLDAPIQIRSFEC